MFWLLPSMTFNDYDTLYLCMFTCCSNTTDNDGDSDDYVRIPLDKNQNIIINRFIRRKVQVKYIFVYGAACVCAYGYAICLKFLIASLLDSFALLLLLVRAHLLAFFFSYIFPGSPTPVRHHPSHHCGMGVSSSFVCIYLNVTYMFHCTFQRFAVIILAWVDDVVVVVIFVVIVDIMHEYVREWVREHAMLSMVFDALWYNHLAVFMDGWIWSVRAMCVYFEFAYLIEKHSNRNYEWKVSAECEEEEKNCGCATSISITSNKRVCMQRQTQESDKGGNKCTCYVCVYAREIEKAREPKCREKSELR